MYRNINTEYGLDPPKSTWEIFEKIMEKIKKRILLRKIRSFQNQTNRQVLVNQHDIVVVDKGQKTETVIDRAVPRNSNIRKKECKKLEKYHSLKEELERM